MILVFDVQENQGILLPDNTAQNSTVFSLAVGPEELQADMASYDPASPTSPSVTVARKYARAIFDAYLAQQPQVP